MKHICAEQVKGLKRLHRLNEIRILRALRAYKTHKPALQKLTTQLEQRNRDFQEVMAGKQALHAFVDDRNESVSVRALQQSNQRRRWIRYDHEKTEYFLIPIETCLIICNYSKTKYPRHHHLK